MCRSCELEISEIQLIVDLRVANMSEFDVILGMNWLSAHWVVIDYDRKRVIAYTSEGVCFKFQGKKYNTLPEAVYDSHWHKQLMGLACEPYP